ncbi:MAG: hypothetical protein PHS02_04130 [Candidatus ainarchaeum sp.]|nr:hypothetical protein [Candidatus ainarchaeum sp.]
MRRIDKMAKICIVCEKEPPGEAYPVADDAIIRFIRAAKRKVNLARNNELYVCKDCHPAYSERRKKFEKNLVFFIAGGVIIFFGINVFQLFFGRFSVFAFLASIFLGVFIGSFPILSYVPALRQGPGLPEAAPVPAPRRAQSERTRREKPRARK